jgi:glycosyltransferase involved in cell wall biosynthesis
MRILTVIYSMDCGGAERVMASLANGWVSRGHQVIVVTLSGETSFYPLSPSVEYRALYAAYQSHNLAERCFNNLRRLRQLRRTIRDAHPDVIVSFLDTTNVMTLLSTFGIHVPVIVCEHNDPSQARCRSVWEVLRVFTYPCASAVTVLTENVLEDMRWLVGSGGTVMPNPVQLPEYADCEPSRNGHVRRLIAIGRLHPQKGFDYLLDAFRQVADKHPDWTLTILGEGPLRRQLEQQIERLGLSGSVDLHGQVKDPFRWLRSADLYVMSSRYEGFPCALCEAMACGLPAISFDCPSGPRAIVRDGVDGMLVPPGDSGALARAMDGLMSDADERRRLASRAPEILQRFSLDSILLRWDELFERIGVPVKVAVHRCVENERC